MQYVTYPLLTMGCFKSLLMLKTIFNCQILRVMQKKYTTVQGIFMINSLPRKKVDQYDNMITTKVINFEIIKQRRYLQGSFSRLVIRVYSFATLE